ncbi:hypothetical protein GCM10008941_18230 [Rhizomicrobium palustre]
MVGSIGSFNPASFAASSALTRKPAKQADDLSAAVSQPDAKASFREYMKMSPAERMEENWLKSHGLSKEKLAAMSPEERDKVMKQMKDEITQALKEKAEKGAMVNIQA